MRKHGWIVFLLAVVVVLMLFHTVAFTVDFRQIGIVKTFGDAEDAIRGEQKAGLHWKYPWPVQQLVRYDARMFVFEDTFKEVATNDKQNVLISVFCVWRIKDANVFIKAIKVKGQAKVKDCEERLRNRLRSAKGDIVANHPLAHFVSTNPKEMCMEDIENEILDKIKADSLREYGVEVVTVGIKSLGLPPDVTKQVIANMKEERKTKADNYRASGEAVANAIRERAKTARNNILVFAQTKAASIRAEGEREAAEEYKKFRKNEEFAMFLRELEFMKETLMQNSEFVLDISRLPCIGYFKDGAPDIPVKKDDSKKAW